MSTAAERQPEPGEQFPNEHLVVFLKYALARLATRSSTALAPYGIDGRELAVLLLLKDKVPLSQQQLARRLHIDRTTMVALVDGLEGKGLVERQPDAGDRRKNVVVLTAAGRGTVRRAEPAADKAERAFLAPLSARDAKRLKESLRVIILAADE